MPSHEQQSQSTTRKSGVSVRFTTGTQEHIGQFVVDIAYQLDNGTTTSNDSDEMRPGELKSHLLDQT